VPWCLAALLANCEPLLTDVASCSLLLSICTSAKRLLRSAVITCTTSHTELLQKLLQISNEHEIRTHTVLCVKPEQVQHWAWIQTKCVLNQLLTSSCLAVSSCEGGLSSFTAFTCTELTMPLALTPNLKEESVSAALSKEGEQQMIKAVLAVPPNESCIASYSALEPLERRICVLVACDCIVTAHAFLLHRQSQSNNRHAD